MWPLLACVGRIASLPRKRHEKKEAQSRIAIFGMGMGMGMGVGASGAVVFTSTSVIHRKKNNGYETMTTVTWLFPLAC